MTNAISSTQKRIISTKPLGDDWGKILEDLVMKEGAKLAEAQLKIGKQTKIDEVLVRVPVTVYVGFPRNGQDVDGDAGRVSAVCVFSADETGSVCVCTGEGAGSCECGQIVV